MRIRMLKTEAGSVDGIRVFSYEKGSEHVLASTDGERLLAAAFVGAGLALDLDDDSGAAAVQVESSEPGGPDPERQMTPTEPATVPPAAKPGRAKKQ